VTGAPRPDRPSRGGSTRSKPTIAQLGVNLTALNWRRSGSGAGSFEVAFVSAVVTSDPVTCPPVDTGSWRRGVPAVGSSGSVAPRVGSSGSATAAGGPPGSGPSRPAVSQGGRALDGTASPRTSAYPAEGGFQADATAEWVLLRVVGDPAARVLIYDRVEWRSFIDGAARGEFDDAAAPGLFSSASPPPGNPTSRRPLAPRSSRAILAIGPNLFALGTLIIRRPRQAMS
jgi:hypothetical protein